MDIKTRTVTDDERLRRSFDMGQRAARAGKQLAVLRLIIAYRAAHSISPTLAEIAAGLGRTRATIVQHIGEPVE